MQIADGALKKHEISAINNVKVDETFEKLLISDSGKSFDKESNYILDEKLFLSDSSKSTMDFNDSPELIKQSLFNKSIMQSNNGSEILELYDQKSYALGKLSYVEKKHSFFSNLKVYSDVEKSISSAIKNSSKIDMGTYISKIDLTAYRPVVSTLMDSSRDLKKGNFLGVNPNFSLVKASKYEREKITHINQGEKTFVYVRNYFSSIEEVGEIITHFFIKFKNQINLIVNGKRR